MIEIFHSYYGEIRQVFGLGVIKAMGVTLVELFRPKVTVRYPEKRIQLPPAFRVAPLLTLDSKTKKAKCVGCGLCVRACPNQVIELETVRNEEGKREVISYSIDIMRCLFCGLCEEACNFDAVKMSHWFELAAYTRYKLHYDKSYWQEVDKDKIMTDLTMRPWKVVK